MRSLPLGQGARKEKGGEQMGRHSRLDVEAKMAIVLEGLGGEGSISKLAGGMASLKPSTTGGETGFSRGERQH